MLVLLAKIMLLAVVLWFFYSQFQNLDIERLRSANVERIWPVVLCAALVFLNWYLEYLKWRTTLRYVVPITSQKQRFQSFMAGIVTGFVTPNLLGNFIGRILYFEADKRPKLIGITLFANAAQFLASVLFGLVSLACIGFPLDFADDTAPVLSVFCVLFALLMLGLYLLVNRIPEILLQWNWTHKFRESLQAPIDLRLELLTLSIFRHVVFSMQFCLLLGAFGLGFSLENFFLVWQVYFWSTLIPSIWLGKLVIRESVALWIFGYYTSQLEAVLLASVLLWLLNQGLTALIGIPYVKYKTKTV